MIDRKKTGRSLVSARAIRISAFLVVLSAISWAMAQQSPGTRNPCETKRAYEAAKNENEQAHAELAKIKLPKLKTNHEFTTPEDDVREAIQSLREAKILRQMKTQKNIFRALHPQAPLI